LLIGEVVKVKTLVQEVIAYEFDDFRLDVNRRELSANGEQLALTYKAFQILLLLVQNFEQTVEKETIFTELWADSFVEDANLTQHIYILRKTLGKKPDGLSYIETVTRTGYRFCASVTPVLSPETTQPRDLHDDNWGKLQASDVQDVRVDERPSPTKQVTEEATVELAAGQSNGSSRNWSLYARVIVATLACVAAIGFGLWIYVASETQTSAPRSVAVLPFEPIGQETSNTQLGIGMADAVITRLTVYRRIPVRPTSSVIGYVDRPDVDSLKVGREMGVDTVLEGTVQQADGRVRVSVKLLDVSNGDTIWGDSFDENFTNIFEVQDSISRRVARALHAGLTPQQESEIVKPAATTSTEALQAYQWGVYYSGTRTKQNMLQAVEYFEQAIEIDPRFARAHAMLADTFNMIRYYRYTDNPQDMRDKALIAANKALELDQDIPEAYVALANAQAPGEPGRLKAKELLEKAIELSPYYANARIRYGWILLLEDFDTAFEQMRLAQEYDPLSPISNGAYCSVLIYRNRYKEAIKECEQAVEFGHDQPMARVWLADAYLLDRRTDDAIAQINLRIAESEGRDHYGAKGSLAYYLARAGRQAEAERLVHELSGKVVEFPSVNNDLALTYYALGKTDEGFKYFLQALEKRAFQASMLTLNPIWADVWADPRVKEKFAENQARQVN
jgi:DNA-binding winged helix-turn-helix (wHTH) protein/TolB-like protein/Tfp pilus assembly protein PilF